MSVAWIDESNLPNKNFILLFVGKTDGLAIPKDSEEIHENLQFSTSRLKSTHSSSVYVERDSRRTEAVLPGMGVATL